MQPYPQQYAQPPMPQYPQQPAAPAYPQQYPAPQAYPQPQYPAQQGYAQQYAPQAYAAPAPVAPPLPAGTLDSFYEQPSSGGGPSFKFMDANRQPMIGKSYVGIVSRPITNADVRPQTGDGGQVRTYKDGRPKFVLVVPMQVPPSQEFPEGVAGWWVKGQARDELARAMAEAGAPAGPPEAGAGIRVTLVGTRAVPGMNPAYQYRIEYMRPNGAQPAPAAPAATPVPQQAPVQQVPAAQPQQMTPPPPVQQMPQPYPQQAPMPQQPTPVAANSFTGDQAELYAKLTGQPAPAAG
jgi:hypothetical protein